MRKELLYKIPKKGLKVWRLYGLINTVVFAIVAVGINVLSIFFDWPKFIGYIAILIVVVIGVMVIWIFPKLRWNHWSYEVREHEIEIQSGLFVVKRTLIPMVRVQHVDTAQGPILKKNDLANISISTAATTHTIPMLITKDADDLRGRISVLARVAEDDV